MHRAKKQLRILSYFEPSSSATDNDELGSLTEKAIFWV